MVILRTFDNKNFHSGQGIDSLPDGTKKHIICKAGYKLVDNLHFRKIAPWKEILRRIKESTSADVLNCRARLQSEHRLTARLIGVQTFEDGQTNAEKTLFDTKNIDKSFTKRLRSVMAGIDYQSTHCKEMHFLLPAHMKHADRVSEDASSAQARREISKQLHNDRWSIPESTRRLCLNTGRFLHGIGDIGNGISTFMYELVNNSSYPTRMRSAFVTRVRILIGNLMAVALITCNSKMINSKTLGNPLTGWFVLSAIAYGGAVAARGFSRIFIVRKGSIQLGNNDASEAYLKKMNQRKNKTLCAILMLTHSIKGCTVDEQVVRKALRGNNPATHLGLSSGKIKGVTENNGEDLFSKIQVAENIDQLQKILHDYLSPNSPDFDGLSARKKDAKLTLRENEFIAIANLVEHYRIEGCKQESDKTSRQKLQEVPLGASHKEGMSVELKLKYWLLKGRFQLKHLSSHFLSNLSLITKDHTFHAENSERLEQRQKEKEAWRKIKVEANARTKLLHDDVEKHDSAWKKVAKNMIGNTDRILKEKKRHYFITTFFAYMAQSTRYIGQQVILSSDTVLGRMLGSLCKNMTKVLLGKDVSLLNCRAIGMIFGVIGIGALLIGTSAIDGVTAPSGAFADFAMTGMSVNPDVKVAFFSLSLMCGVFVVLSMMFDGLAKGSIKAFGHKSLDPIDISKYHRLGRNGRM